MVISTVGKAIYKTITKKKNKVPTGISKTGKPTSKPGTRMQQKPKPKPTYGKPKKSGY